MRATRMMKAAVVVTVLVIALAAPMSASAAPPTPSSESSDAGVMAAPIYGSAATVWASSGLRLRQGPSLYDPIILVLRNGETVYPGAGPVWGSGIQWTWVRVYRYGRYYEGFCASNYLSTSYHPGTPSYPSPQHGLKVTASAGLRLRSGPGTGYAILKVVPYGTVLGSVGQSEWNGGIKWSRVSYGGLYYWAASSYLTWV